jgi:hypothetical protein
MSHAAPDTAQGRDKDKEEEEEREQMCDVWALIMTAMLAVTDHQKKFLESIEVTLLLNHFHLFRRTATALCTRRQPPC